MKRLLLLLNTLCTCQYAYAQNPKMDDLTSNLQEFAAHTYTKIAENADDSDNIFFSPSSVAEGIAMLMAGAGGNTYKEIEQALVKKPHFSYSQDNYINLFRKIYNKAFNIEKKNSTSKVLMANAGFIQNSYPVNPSYIRVLENKFKAHLGFAAFDNALQASESINDWVDEKTDGMIKDLMAPGGITEYTRLVLVNALYFQAKWGEEKMSTKGLQDHQFHISEVRSKRVTFMGMEAILEYSPDQATKQYRLPYNIDDTYMVIIMPNNKEEMDTFTQYANLPDFVKRVTKMRWRQMKARFRMPKFVLDQSLDMTQILHEMNVRDVFDAGRANLSGISNEDLHVSSFTHKAKISVDEEGTTAAAATKIEIAGRSAGIREIWIDRPFLFLIHRGDHILFFGRVVDPPTGATLD